MKLIDYAHKMGISYRTAWRWYKAGKIKGKQMDTGTIIVLEEDTVNHRQAEKVAVYARVSSAENKPNLDSQAERLTAYCSAKGYQVAKVVKEPGMSRIPTGVLIWSLKRYTRDTNLWDRLCFRCKQATPVFEYEHRDEQERSLFHYLCEECAQKKLAEWLQCAASPDYVHLGYQTDFDIAIVFYEQKNDGETMTLTRWSAEQRRRRLQGDDG